MARIAAFALERQRKTATALFANLNGGRDENWSLATSCGLDAFERGGVLQNQYHRDIDKLSRTFVYTVNRNTSLYHIHGLYVIDNMNLVK